jgi:hypothetical protein
MMKAETILRQFASVTIRFGHQNVRRPCIAKRITNVKKVIYVIIFQYSWNCCSNSCSRGCFITSKYYRDVVLRKIKINCNKILSLTGMKDLYFLHDNAPAHKGASVIVLFRGEKKSASLKQPAYSPDLAPRDISSFLN